MSEEAKATGLLEWMNSFPEVQELGITSLVNTRDGIAIATLWNCISASKIDITSLEKPSSDSDWLTRRKNLGAIDTVISPILTEKHLRESDRIDLTSIARKENLIDIIHFIEPLVMVSLTSPIKKDVVARIKTLSPNGRRVVKNIIESFKKKDKPDTEAKPNTETSDEMTATATPDVIRPLELEISATKQRISQLNDRLTELQKQSGKIYRKTNQEQAQEIADMEQRLEDTNNANRELETQLEASKKQEGELERKLALMVRKQEVLKEVKDRQRREMEAKQNLESMITQLEKAIATRQKLEQNISKAKEAMEKEKQDMDVIASGDDKEIQEIKDEIKITVDLAEKYSAVDDGTDPVDVEGNEESVTELAARISQMEIEIAILNDDLASGKSGIPKDTQVVQEELKKALGKLLRKKRRLEEEKKQIKSLREDLQRVQTLIITQKEEVEKELESLAVDINARNIDLTNWLSYSSSFDSWRLSPTFMSELRSRYP